MMVDFGDLTCGVIMIHLFTFDPSWFRPKQAPGARNVVLFDGICGMCNGAVNFLLENDMNHTLVFSPLQGEFAQSVLPAEKIQKLDSICYYSNGVVHDKSNAIIQIACDLGGIWAFARVLKIIPAPLRDALYNLIAKNRYRLFGKKEQCRMPTPEERDRFLP